MEINPNFSELTNAETVINHIETIKSDALNEAMQTVSNGFPIEVFPNGIQKIITATNEALNFPIDFISSSILYATSVAIGNSYRAEIMRGYEQTAVIYLAIVGKAGTTKTHPLKFALKPLEQLDGENYQTYLKEKSLYDNFQNLSKTDKEAQEEEPPKPYWRQHLISDFTPEALATVHLNNSKGLGVNVDELATWFKNFNRYNKGSEQEFWLSVWSGNAIKVNRKSSEPINISHPFISVGGTIQPAILDELAKGRTENGFVDRLLFCFPDNLKKQYWSEKELDVNIPEQWKQVINKLLHLADIHEPQTLQFTPEAKKILFAFQRKITDDSNIEDNEDVAGLYAKIEQYSIRFSLILQLLECATTGEKVSAINATSARGAVSLCNYFLSQSIKVFDYLNNNEKPKDIPETYKEFLDELPPFFETHEAVSIGKDIGIPERSVKRFLTKRDFFKLINRGQYERI